jgi:hypothetical protein
MHRVRRAPSRRLIAARDLVAARAIATAKESPRHKKEPYIRAVSLSPRGLGHASFRVKLAHWRMLGKRLHWDEKCRIRKSRLKWGNALVIRAVSGAWEFDVWEFPLGGNHIKVGCRLPTFGAVSRAAITASTVINAIRIISSDTGQVAP